MTIDEMKRSTKQFLIPSDIAEVLESDPHTIRCTARETPELIGYRFTFSGSHMKIPRVPFLRWLGEDPEVTE